MTTSEFAINLNDRSENSVSLRAHTATVRMLRAEGVSVKAIASVFGKSYEWTRRVIKNLEYEYDYYGAGNIAVDANDLPCEVNVVPAS